MMKLQRLSIIVKCLYEKTKAYYLNLQETECSDSIKNH